MYIKHNFYMNQGQIKLSKYDLFNFVISLQFAYFNNFLKIIIWEW